MNDTHKRIINILSIIYEMKIKRITSNNSELIIGVLNNNYEQIIQT